MPQSTCGGHRTYYGSQFFSPLHRVGRANSGSLVLATHPYVVRQQSGPRFRHTNGIYIVLNTSITKTSKFIRLGAADFRNLFPLLLFSGEYM